MLNSIMTFLGSIVTLATVAVVISSTQLAGILRAFGDFFAGAIDAAQRV